MFQFQRAISIISFLVLATSMMPTLGMAQQRVDVLHLKNGSVIRGVVIEEIPNVSVKIRTSDGSEFVYAWDLIEKIVTEEAALRREAQRAGERDRFKGFLIGFGAGVGTSKIGGSDSEFSITTDFKIGYAPSNLLALYYFGKVAWFGKDTFCCGSVTIANGIGGIGASYAVTKKFFANAGIGVSTLSAPFDSDIETDSGTGFVFGGEYEFASHFFIDLDLLLASFDGVNSTTVKLSINWLHY